MRISERSWRGIRNKSHYDLIVMFSVDCPTFKVLLQKTLHGTRQEWKFVLNFTGVSFNDRVLNEWAVTTQWNFSLQARRAEKNLWIGKIFLFKALILFRRFRRNEIFQNLDYIHFVHELRLNWINKGNELQFTQRQNKWIWNLNHLQEFKNVIKLRLAQIFQFKVGSKQVFCWIIISRERLKCFPCLQLFVRHYIASSTATVTDLWSKRMRTTWLA